MLMLFAGSLIRNSHKNSTMQKRENTKQDLDCVGWVGRACISATFHDDRPNFMERNTLSSRSGLSHKTEGINCESRTGPYLGGSI